MGFGTAATFFCCFVVFTISVVLFAVSFSILDVVRAIDRTILVVTRVL